MENAKTALIDYINNLTPAQAKKLEDGMPLLKQLSQMSKNELIFAETFLSKVCGSVTPANSKRGELNGCKTGS